MVIPSIVLEISILYSVFRNPKGKLKGFYTILLLLINLLERDIHFKKDYFYNLNKRLPWKTEIISTKLFIVL